MKNLAILFFLFIFSLTANGQTPKATPRKSPKPVKTAAVVKLGTEDEEFKKATNITEPSARIAALQAFIKNFPASAEIPKAQTFMVTARAELGIMRLQAKDIKGGVEFYRLAIEESPAPVPNEMFSKVLIGLPVSLYTLNERGAAFDIAKLIEEKVGANAAQVLDLSRFYLNVEYGTEAIRLAQKAVELAPDSAAAYQTLAAANRLNFRLDDAAAAYAKAAELEGESAVSKLSLAEMKRALGKSDEAITIYREILAKEPENKPAQAGLTLALFDTGKRPEAEAEMKKALEADAQNARLMTGAAYWYAARGLNEQAIEYSRRAIAIEPRNVWSYIAQARALTAQGKPLEAEKTLLLARQYSDFPTLDYELATVRLAAGLYREAAETLQRSFKVNKDGTVETYLGNRILADAGGFTELLSLERRVALFETNAADNEEGAKKLKSLLEFIQKLVTEDTTEDELALAAEQFAVGDDNMRLHRQLFAANRLLQKKKALPKVLELMQAAISGVDSALNVASPSAAVLADEIYESRDYAIKQNLIVVVPEIPRPTLSAILRGRIEDTAGLALFRQNNVSQSIVRLKRALSVLPEKSAWSRASYWNLGEALQADGKEKEALEAYLKSYDKEFPNASRRAFIETLYIKVNGNTEGLDDRIGVKPETTVATTENKTTPDNTDNGKTEPSPAPEVKPETLPSPETLPTPQTTETPQPTEVKTEPSPSPQTETTPETKTEPTPVLPQNVPGVTPEKSPEVSPSPEVTPKVEEVKNTETAPEEVKTEDVKKEVKPEEVKPEPSPSPSPTEPTTTDEVQPTPTPETKPEEVKPAETKPDENKPTEIKPVPTPAPSPQNLSVVITDTLVPIPPAAKISETKPESNKANNATPQNLQKPIFDPVIISVGKTESSPTNVKSEPTPAAVENKTEEKPAEKINEEKPIEEKPTEQVKTPEVVITDTKIVNETTPTEIQPENKPSEKQTDERILSGERRPRIIITENTGAKTVTEEISTCKLTITPDTLSLINSGGSLGVNVGFEGEGDFREIRGASSSPEDVEVMLDTDVGASQNRAFFIVKSRSAKTGVFTVTFEAPCGKKEILVRVR